ncbi:MAG: helix-turn-helix domain-containing protein [Phycisphaerales bacterium]|nr:helix-turn-helix domain-containing protein [Phycisphaerales bacterium]
MSARVPAEVFPPGDFIAEELDARGWAQEDLARILAKPLPTVNKIIKGKTAITPATAKKLSAAFGTSAELWMNLESSWQLYRDSDDESSSEVRERASIYDLAPVREMVRRGWIQKTDSSDDLVQELRKHFGVEDVSEVPAIRAAARSSTRGESGEITAAQWAWMCRCRNVSRLTDASRYRKKDLIDCIPELVALSSQPEEIRKLPGMLADCGVRVVLVKHLKGTAIDGGALWCNKTSEPVVGLSARFGRLDNFWFTLMHEIAHIIAGDGVVADSEIDRQSDHIDVVEQRANRTAASWLVPQDDLSSFIRRTSPLYSTRKILNFARRIRVHPSLIVGQLKHRGEVSWDKFNGMSIDVRDYAKQAIIQDGWDGPAPIE